MGLRIYTFLILLFSSFIYCKEECQWPQTHLFEAKADVTLVFSAEIKRLNGLIIDINYEKKENDRISISTKKSEIFKHDDTDYTTTIIDSLLNEGWQDMHIYVSSSYLKITCTSSEMVPVIFYSQSIIKSIKVSALKLKICEERCSIEVGTEKIIDNDDRYHITAFTTSNYPIIFEINHANEGGEFYNLEINPKDCILKWGQSSKIIPCKYIIPGWNKLNIFANRTTLAINENIILQKDDTLKAIRITGQYLVICSKGTPTWKITNQEEVKIPIASGQEIGIDLTSATEFSPVFNIDGINFKLNWNNGLKFGLTGKALKPNFYHIIFKATSDKLILYNEQKSEQQLLIELKVDEVPEFISVSSLNGEYKLSLSIQDPHKHTPEHGLIVEQTLVTSSAVDGLSNFPHNTKHIVIGVLVPIVIAAIIVSSVFGWKKMNKTILENNQGYDTRSRKEDITLLTKSSSTSTKNGNRDEEEEIEIIIENPSSSSSQSSLTTDMHQLVDNIKSCNIYGIKETISSGKISAEESLIEAHIRDNMEVVQAIMKTEDFQRLGLKKDNIIMKVMEMLDERIQFVFIAIKAGKLYGSDSASSLLTDYGLPGTIRDTHGNSLLHCLVLPFQNSNQFHNADDIKAFIKEHKVLVSSVNYKGQSPLHTVANEASKTHDTNTWQSIANILLDVGCEPRIRDNNGQLPEDIALDRGCIYLQKLLTKNRMTREEMDLKSKIEQWSILLKETTNNNVEGVTQLLLENVPILPLCSTSDPLRVAISRGYLELTMLLLSAGAPLCGRPLRGLNSLEVSPSTPELTAFIPALIRREFYNCLRSETELLTNNDTTWYVLKAAVLDLSEAIKRDGYKNTNLNFRSQYRNICEKSEESRKFLSLAASIGMGLTCQMLGLEDVFLHPLPLEISPDSNAKPNTLCILYRDLDLSMSLKFGNIPSHLKEENEDDNLNKLKHFCKISSIDFHTLYDEQSSINKTVLKCIAEQGLDTAYKNIFARRNGKLVDTIVDDVTGFTMLHTAAYNGCMGMVEYLLLNKANENIKTKTGFSAAHIAAMRGHKECMEYILAFSKLEQPMVDGLTPSGLTALQISDGYSFEVKHLDNFLLHESISHPILSEPKFKKKTRLILNEKQSLIKECLQKGSLDHIVPLGYINEHRAIWQQLNEESQNFIQKLKDIDSRFSGKIIKQHINEDALELLLMESYQIYLEIDNSEFWQDKNLHEAFVESGYKTLQKYTVKSENLCIVPPVFKPTLIGANIFLSYCSQQITTHISIHVIPILKTKLDLNTEGLELNQIFNETITQALVTHIAKTKSEKCSYVTVDLEKQLFAKLDSRKLIVLSLCRFIKKILYPHWWFPRLESRRHGRQWHHYAVSLQSAPERLLIPCFLLEVFKVPEEKWDNLNILDRVLGVYKQMVIEDKNGEVVILPNAKSFLDPGKEDIKLLSNIPVIIDFLHELRKNS